MVRGGYHEALARVGVQQLKKTPDHSLQLSNFLRIVAVLAQHVELVEEENGWMPCRVLENAPQIGGRLPEIRRHDPVEPSVENR